MYLVTGAKGQLGTELKVLLNESAVYLDRDDLDIASETAVKNFLETNDFECIVNCAAYTAVDKAEIEPVLADETNHLGVKWLAKYGKRIIHISTDYVFDGSSNTPYLEDDKTDPVSVYGKTKLAGERAVMNYAETAVIIRTAWLYSLFGNNFLKTMLRLGKERKSINVVSDQIGSPTYAGDLAKLIVQLLPQLKSGEKNIYHFTNEGVCSWYDFAHSIMQISGADCKVKPIGSHEYPTIATRPVYSVLNKAKIKRDFNIDIPHWRDALTNVLKNMKEN